jgi:two-component system sensor histidine kinase/response regulator
MHFIGMLGFRLPCPITYDPWITGLSILPGVLASSLALHIVSRDRATGRTLVNGGVLLAAGIGAMHYIGMTAIRLDGVLRYDPARF